MKALLGLYDRPDIVETILKHHNTNTISHPRCSLCGRGTINFISGINFTSEDTGKVHNVEILNPKFCPLCGKEL